MSRLGVWVAAGFFVGASGCTTVAKEPPPSAEAKAPASCGPQKIDHVLLIVLENQDVAKVEKNPGFQNLAKRGAYFTHSMAVAHPSYDNYLALMGIEITPALRLRMDKQTDFPVDTRSIVDQLEGPRSWKSYVESYPAAADRAASGTKRCGTVVEQGRYVRRHVPLLSFGSVQTDEARCKRIVDASEFERDIRPDGTFPTFAFYTPDLCHDGHGSTPASGKVCDFGSREAAKGLVAADTWLTDFLAHMTSVNSALVSRTLIIVTFDESENYVGPNRIFTVFLGPMVRPGPYDQKITHYTVLRTIEDRLGLCPVGAEAKEHPIDAIWQ
jgi:acid phosphatase